VKSHNHYALCPECERVIAQLTRERDAATESAVINLARGDDYYDKMAGLVGEAERYRGAWDAARARVAELEAVLADFVAWSAAPTPPLHPWLPDVVKAARRALSGAAQPRGEPE
jgi:phage-related protein